MKNIAEITPTQLSKTLSEDSALILLDVREPHERAAEYIPNSLHLPRGDIPQRIADIIPDRSARVVCYCAGGVRSLLAAATMAEMGYADVSSLAGGITGWKSSGFSVQCDAASSCTSTGGARYARQIILPQVGTAGQSKLSTAKVLIVGAGGLGSPAALYLAAAGVGTIGICDGDAVELSNLQRQILHSTVRIGMSKAHSARETLSALNPDITVNAHAERLTTENVDRIIAPYDLVLDGCDNFTTRYLINDACVRHRKVNVHGSVMQFAGQVSVYWPGRGPCYTCVFPEPPRAEDAPSCAEAGVLGVVPGVIGTMQASEALKIILGIGEPLVGKLLCYDALTSSWTTMYLAQDQKCSCASEK